MSCHRAFLPKNTMLFVNTTSLILGEAETITVSTFYPDGNGATETLSEPQRWQNRK